MLGSRGVGKAAAQGFFLRLRSRPLDDRSASTLWMDSLVFTAQKAGRLRPSLDYFCPIKVRSNKIQLQKEEILARYLLCALRTCTFLSTYVCKPKDVISSVASNMRVHVYSKLHPKDHWTLKTGYFEDPNYSAIQVQTLPLEGPRSLGQINVQYINMPDFPCILHSSQVPPSTAMGQAMVARYRFRIRVECPSDACMKNDENRSGDRAGELRVKGTNCGFQRGKSNNISLRIRSTPPDRIGFVGFQSHPKRIRM